MNETTDEDGIIKIDRLEAPKTIDRTPLVRERLAVGSMLIVPFTITVAFGAAALSPATASVIKEIAVAVIPPLIVAFSGILGFYFGSQRHEAR